MRSLIIASSLLALAAHAEPARRGEASETGNLRDVRLRAPEVAASGTVAAQAPDSEHGVQADRLKAREPAPLSGALLDVVERQMRKNVASIEACTVEAAQRNPAAAGSLQVTVQIAERKVTQAGIAQDTVKDPALAACLVKAARGWTFTLKSAEFAWPVSLARRQLSAR